MGDFLSHGQRSACSFFSSSSRFAMRAASFLELDGDTLARENRLKGLERPADLDFGCACLTLSFDALVFHTKPPMMNTDMAGDMLPVAEIVPANHSRKPPGMRKAFTGGITPTTIAPVQHQSVWSMPTSQDKKRFQIGVALLSPSFTALGAIVATSALTTVAKRSNMIVR